MCPAAKKRRDENTAPRFCAGCAPFSNCRVAFFRDPRLGDTMQTPLSQDMEPLLHFFWHKLSFDDDSMARESYRIIVVEDHASTAEALRKFLTTIGYKVYIAPDIASARALANAIEL